MHRTLSSLGICASVDSPENFKRREIYIDQLSDKQTEIRGHSERVKVWVG